MSDTSLIFTILGKDQSGPALNSASQRLNKMKLAAVAAFGAATAVIGQTINKAANFDQSIRIAGTAAGATAVQMKQMSDQALAMGSKTQFGAQGAADAMVELAKAGITPAEMAAGALQGTMTLAAAGGLELGNAAGYVTNAMNTFGLAAKDAGDIAAALAGGANASTASVESLALGLAQVGPGAKNAGLSLQDTVGVLSAFDQAGIKGSDAGTSLKTMLTRLVPSTKQAKDEMKGLGLSFVDAKGSFLPIDQIAQQLQDHFKGMSEAQRVAALNTIFGSDATRAATVLMNNGKAGIDKYVQATKDKAAADKLAKAQTDGAAGNMKKFKAAIDSLQIAVGLKLLPAVTKLTGGLTDMVNYVTSKVNPVFDRLSGFASKTLAPAFDNVKDKVKDAFKSVDISGAGKNFAKQAQGWAGDIIGGVKAGFDTGNWGPLGKSLGNGLGSALKNVGTGTLDLAGMIRQAVGKVDWFKVGKSAVGVTLNFVLGFASALLDPAVWGSVIKNHWKDIAFLIVTLGTDGVGGIIGKIGTKLRSLGFLGKVAAFMLEGAAAASNKLLKGAEKLGLSILRGVGKGVADAFPGLAGVFARGGGRIKGMLQALAVGVVSIGVRIKNGFKSALSALPSAIENLFSRMTSGALRVITGGFKLVDRFLGGVPGKILGVFADAGSWLFQAGKDIMGGLVNGLKSMAMVPVNAAKNIGSNVVSGVKGLFGIKSPSRVMMEVGKNIVEGLTSGVKSKQKDALSAVKDLVTKMKDKLQTIKDFAKAIKDSFIATADLTNLTGDDSTNSLILFGGGTGGFAGMLKNLQQKAADATAFASGITQLRKMGLNETSIRQLRDAGPDQGGLAVQQLLSGGAGGIGQVNSLVKQIIGTGEDFAGKEAKKKYGINPYKSQPVTVKTVHSKITIDFTNAGAENALVEAIRKAVRKKGGNVQLVLGK